MNAHSIDDEARFKSFCFPSNASNVSTSNYSVNSYLRNIYDDSVSNNSFYPASSYSAPYSAKVMNDNVSTMTSNITEKNEIFKRLNNYSLERANENSNNNSKNQLVHPIKNSQNQFRNVLVKDENNSNSTFELKNHSDSGDEDDDDGICPRSQSRTPVSFSHSSLGNNNETKKFLQAPKMDMDRSPTGRTFSHRKSNAISLTKSFQNLKILDDTNTSNNSLYLDEKINYDDRYVSGIYYDDDDDDLISPISPFSYPHHLSPKETIYDTMVQIKRNKNGNFDNLDDFCAKNNINTRGKSFVEPLPPKIDLQVEEQ